MLKVYFMINISGSEVFLGSVLFDVVVVVVVDLTII